MKKFKRNPDVIGRAVLIGVLAVWGSTASANEVQLSCKFVSETKVSKLNPSSPDVRTTKIDTEFLVFVDSAKNQAAYINLKYKVKSPLLIVVNRKDMTTLIEKDGSDNHFSLSIFQPSNSDGSFPAVMYSHAWNPKIDFYAPTMTLGQCHKVS